MHRAWRFSSSLLALLLIAFVASCGDESPSQTSDDDNPPGNMPPVPVPGSTSELLPAVSESFIVGLSTPLSEFVPVVSELRMMLDDGSEPWITMNRRLILACEDVLPSHMNNASAAGASYISDRPRLMHYRYWRKIKQVTLDPGTSYSHEETISYGTSTSHTESNSFSQTIGVEVSVGGGWGPFSASVTASFEQTSTHDEIDTVTFTEESSFTETYAVQSQPGHTIVFALWQLVDAFALVDADSVRIDESPVLTHAHVPEIPDIVFPNRDVIYQSVTVF